MLTILYRILPLAVLLLSHPAVAQVLTHQAVPALAKPLPAIPEPSAAAAFALGALLLAGVMRRRR